MSMDINAFLNVRFGDKKEEVVKKAMQSRTPEDLIVIAKEYGQDLDSTQAAKIFEKIHPETKVLSDDELDMVAGGKGGGSLECESCGSENVEERHPGGGKVLFICNACGYYWWLLPEEGSDYGKFFWE